MKKINKIISIISWIIFILVVFRIIFSYESLPNMLGVHFEANGEFDVYTSKKDLLLLGYPYIMSLIILSVSEGIMFSINKMKIGFKVTKDGEVILKDLVKLIINISRLFFVIFLGIIWGECMIRQLPLNITFMKIFVCIYLVIMFICFIFIYKTAIKYNLKRRDKNAESRV